VGVESTTPVVIGTDCIGSCKSNYHMITTIEALPNWRANSLYTAFYKATISLQKGWLYKRSTTILNCNFMLKVALNTIKTNKHITCMASHGMRGTP
jgi:hypothetical protein